MKKISLILALTSLVSMFGAASASAANVAGKTVRYTETEAYINTRPIEAFMVADHTCVRVDDLSQYGFLYQWDAKARAIYVSANTIWGNIAWNTNPTPAPGQAVYHFAHQWAVTAGVPFINNSAYDHQLYGTTVPSDVKVYMNGNEVVSYHTGSEVLVQLKDLVLAGTGIEKFYDPVNNRSWINVLRTNFDGTVLVPLFMGEAAPAANLSTGEAIAQANAYLAANYNGLVVENGDEFRWRSFYADVVAGNFTFPILDTNSGLVIGNVNVGYNNPVQDEICADTLTVMQQVFYQK